MYQTNKILQNGGRGCLPVASRWFSPGTPASSTTKTGRHDIAEILLKVALNNKNHHHHHLHKVTLSCFVHILNLQRRARTHAVLVIRLYELLGYPTT
jgi:hypothetical protein